MLAAALGGLAALALAAEPQCSPSQQSCAYSIDSDFGDFLRLYLYKWWSPARSAVGRDIADAACTPEFWRGRQRCATHCPLRLEVTDPPAHRNIYCVEDNNFAPYQADAHIDLEHSMNNKVFDIKALGTSDDDPRRVGCDDADYAGKNFTNSIALFTRGQCFFYAKHERARAAGAVAGITVNNDIFHYRQLQYIKQGGTGKNLPDFPAVMLPRHDGMLLYDALDAGVALKGKFVFSCDPVTEMPDDDPEAAAYHAACQTTQVRGMCGAEENATRRLCSVCPVEMQLAPDVPDTMQIAGGVNVSSFDTREEATSNNTICLYNNDLLPSKSATFLPLARSLPWTASEGEVVYVPSDALVHGGCRTSDFEGLSGRTVLVRWPSACLSVTLVLRAQRAGVNGVIFYLPAALPNAFVAEGSSGPVEIPVHTVPPSAYSAIVALQNTTGGAWIPIGNGSTRAYALPPMAFTAGRADASDDARFSFDRRYKMQNTLSEVPRSVSFEWTPAVVICMMVIVVLVGVICFMVNRAFASLSCGESGVPVSVASVAVSVSLLAIIAASAFGMAYQAGEDSVDLAVDSGTQAVNETFKAAEVAIDNLAKQLMSSAMLTARLSLKKGLETGRDKCKWTQAHYGLSDDTWATFDSKWMSFASFGRIFATNWEAKVYTTKGFYASSSEKTDDRPDEQRGDGVVGSVAETENGFLYGVNLYHWDNSQNTAKYWATARLASPFQSLGSGLGDPLAVTREMSVFGTTWRLSGRTYPNFDKLALNVNQLSLSVFAPVLDASSDWMGTASAQVSLASIDEWLSQQRGASTQNLSLVLFDFNRRVIAFSPPGEEKVHNIGRKVATYIDLHGLRSDLQQLYTLADSPYHILRAFNRYLLVENITYVPSEDEDTRVHVLNERDYRAPLHRPAFALTVNQTSGVIADISGRVSDFEMRGGACGACVRVDPATQRRVMAFDGQNMLFLYHNLTVDAPQVRAARVATEDGSWKSSDMYYESIMPMKDTYCPAMTVATPTGDGGGRGGALVNMTYCLGRGDVLHQSYSLTIRVRPEVTVPPSGLVGGVSPRLFSTVVVGNALARWQASGALYLGTVEYGCRTQPLPDGLPGGAWTTLTAVVEPEQWTGDASLSRRCSVYANGTLVSRGRMSETYQAAGMYSGDPSAWTVGQNFRGDIDYIHIEQSAYTDGEIRALHALVTDASAAADADRATLAVATEDVEREVASRVWYATFLRDTNIMGDWILAGLLPRDDIMRETDRHAANTLRNLNISGENTDAQLRQRTAEALLVLFVIGLFSIVVFLAFNEILTKPFESIAETMVAAAAMKLDRVQPAPSALREVKMMQDAMGLMVQNLKEYRSYMPHWLMSQSREHVSREESDDDDSSESDASIAVVPQHTATSETVRTSSQSDRSNLAPRVNSQMHSARVLAARCRELVTTFGLTPQKITLLCINIVNFEAMVEQSAPQQVVSIHASVLAKVIAIADFNRGVTETFSGDRFLVSFNAVKTAVMHPQNACQAAWDLTAKLEEDNQVTTTMAVASGPSRVGRLGNDEMRRLAFVSPLLGWCITLERVGRWREMQGHIIVDQSVLKDAAALYYFMCVDQVLYPKLQATPRKVADLRGPFSVNDEAEWMYVLHSGAQVDPFRVWNDWVEAIFACDWSVAQALIDDAAAVSTRCKVAEARFVALREYLECRPSQYEPLQPSIFV